MQAKNTIKYNKSPFLLNILLKIIKANSYIYKKTKIMKWQWQLKNTKNNYLSRFTYVLQQCKKYLACCVSRSTANFNIYEV